MATTERRSKKAAATAATKRPTKAAKRGAKKAAKRAAGPRPALDPALPPMYATTARALPAEGDWVYEPKYDGVRVLAHASPDGVRLVTRNGKDKAAQFPEIVGAVQALARRRGRTIVLDGEIVAMDGDEPARFQALQSRMHLKDAPAIARLAAGSPASLVVFDLLADGDEALLDRPWRDRRRRLERVIGRRPPRHLQLGASLETSGDALLDEAHRRGWEGIIAKRADATYRAGARSRDWLKLKIEHRQEFVVGGWTEPRRTRPYLGALLLGYHDAGGTLVYAGHAGGGLTHDGLRDMRARLERLARRTPPFADAPRPNETVHWVRPQVVVEVRFSEWTADGRLRQPIVLGVRDDKAAKEVVREPESVQQRVTSDESRVTSERRGAAPKKRSLVTRHSSLVARLHDIELSTGDGTLDLGDGVTLDVTSLGKPYFPAAGLTKGDLMRYYAWAAPLLLPRLADRPLVLRRHPRGAAGPSFFQQNAPPSVPDGVRVETIVNDEGEEQRRFVGGDLATLLYLVQLGTISMDAWHERVGSFGVADYGVIDLDPGKGVPFTGVIEVARALRDVLQAEGLAASPKTSGKRGIHVYLPLPGGTAEEEALALAKRLAEQVVERLPRLATIERSVQARPRRSVYVDYLQNIRAKPVAAPYCVRATPEATVSTPLRWEELTDDLDPKAFTIETVPERVARIGDVWGI